jgi:Bacterial pre-peptidase C-terminal domain
MFCKSHKLFPSKASSARLCHRLLVLFAALFLTLQLFAATKKPAKMPPRPKIPPGKSEIFTLEPRGIQRGIPSKIKLIGTNLIGLTELKLHSSQLKGEFLDQPAPTTNVVWITITAATNLARGPYELSVKNTNSESGRLKLYVDDLPQAYESDSNGAIDAPNHGTRNTEHTTTPASVPKLPVSFWGVLDPPGDFDDVFFDARAGESLVFDLAAISIDSKANAMLTIFDQNGALLASNNGFDGGDPLLNFRVPASGRYRVRISERTDAGSKDHFYRLSIGTFPVVFACFPLGITGNSESDIQLLGFNLQPHTTVHVKSGPSGEIDVPVDPEKFRIRGALKAVISNTPELVEVEPNDSPTEAMKIPVPSVVDGRIWSGPEYPLTKGEGKGEGTILMPAGFDPGKNAQTDVDLFQFEAKAGQTLVIETDAARRRSPIDTKIEILHPDGKPVEQVLLQAVRDSHITFRPIDSVTDDLRVENWQEMELNQYMYLQGEVCKIFRMPQGPDSGFQFYSIGGKRRDYFGTSGVAHALDEPAYIVQPRPNSSKLEQNGLPIFRLYYANDDDSDRKLGTDSRLLFKPPTEGTYLVRVTDTRGHSGERFAYRLILREAKPDFKVTLAGANPAVNAGSGKEFSVNADRLDGFEGDIKVDIAGLPPGFSASTPVVIQAGHLEAKGVINAAVDAPKPDETNSAVTKVTASAIINGREVLREVNSLGKIQLAEKPKLFVSLEPYDEKTTNFVERSLSDPPLEITVIPGQTVPAWLKVKRNGHEDLITFSIEGLPHGVIVDNIGLNGVLIPKGEDARQIFLNTEKWVPDLDRFCFAKAAQAENQTSLPVLVHVRETATQAKR